MTRDVAIKEREAVSLPGTERLRVRAEPSGHVYDILIAHPQGEPPARGFPVIVVLDGDALFPLAASAVRLRSNRPDATGVSPALVVGIGYGGALPYDRERRAVDFGARADAPAGPQDFQRFLMTQVRPLLAARAAIDEARQTLLGHSLGALFVLERFLAAPRAFAAHVAISPSVWSARERVRAAADALPPSTAGRLLVTVGEYEQRMAPWQRNARTADDMRRRRDERRMVDDARDVVDRIARAAPGVRADFRELAGEDHASVVTASLTPALRLAAGETLQ